VKYLAIDFGTSNSLACRVSDGRVEFARFSDEGTSNPTVIYFPDKRGRQYFVGNDGIERYLHELEEHESAGRLMLSIKSLLPDAKFDYTTVTGHGRQAPEDLVGKFLIKLRELAERQFGMGFDGVVLGRPVDFSELAVQRLEWAARMAGFTEIRFWLEPAAAAAAYEMTAERDELVCVVDIGGGTSDICVIETSPSRTYESDRIGDIKAVAGVYQAGDELNASIMKSLLAPRFGAGSTYTSLGKVLPFPVHIIQRLSRWHRINLLRAEGVIATLAEIKRTSDRPDDVERVYKLVKQHLGFELFRAIDTAKRELSDRESTEIYFRPLDLDEPLEIRVFESIIEPVVLAIESSIMECLAAASVGPERIDRVVLTGGTSQVPILDRLVRRIFGDDKVHRPDFFASVATGLGYVAARF
jgi:hypothetical chaperone protein